MPVSPHPSQHLVLIFFFHFSHFCLCENFHQLVSRINTSDEALISRLHMAFPWSLPLVRGPVPSTPSAQEFEKIGTTLFSPS